LGGTARPMVSQPEQFDHLNDLLVLGDAVIEQHRS
jgi:hypothetical protein